MLSDEFDRRLFQDREEVDLVIVIGTSLRVAPVASLVSHVPHSVPQIVINRDPITHANFDIHLLGDADTIVGHLCAKLAQLSTEPKAASPLIKTALGEWNLGRVPVRTTGNESVQVEDVHPERVGESHVWLFPGADREHRWTRAVARAHGGEGSREENSAEEGSAVGGASARIRTPPGTDDESDSEADEAGLAVPSAEASRPGSRARSEGSDGEVSEEVKKARLE